MKVWYVIGDPEHIPLHTKLDAEQHARHLFPHEDVHKRYARVMYRMVQAYVMGALSTPWYE
jgi:hypothetical protein